MLLAIKVHLHLSYTAKRSYTLFIVKRALQDEVIGYLFLKGHCKVKLYVIYC